MMLRLAVLATILAFAAACAHADRAGPVARSDVASDATADLRGKTVTTYVLYEAKIRLDAMAQGQVLEVATDDFPAIETDLRTWTRRTGRELIAVRRGSGQRLFYLKKTVPDPPAAPKTVAIVISDAGLEELLSPLGFALAAALLGQEVHIYFQGPAIRVLKRDFKGKLKGASKPFSGFARRGMARTGHIEPQEKLKQLESLGARFYACAPSMARFKVDAAEFGYQNVTVAEYFTFMDRMLEADVQFYEH